MTEKDQAVQQYLEHWIENVHKKAIRLSSYMEYRKLIDKHILPGLGHIKLQRLTIQQVEAFSDPNITANDCLRPVSRYFDRLMRPEQIMASLPQAIRVLTDPAECGPVTLALPQDVQAEAYDYPESFFLPHLSGFFHHRDGHVALLHHLPADLELLQPLLAGEVIHQVEHKIFEDHAQTPGSHLALQRFARYCPGGILAEFEADIFELK